MVFVAIMPEVELWEGEIKGVKVQGHAVLLLKLNQQIIAWEDCCRHLGVPLSRGSLQNGILTCSAHHWQYDACTGKGLNPQSVQLNSIPVRTAAGQIQVDIPGKAE